MRYAVNLPVIGEYSEPGVLVELAREAEAAGWEAVFVWDSMVFDLDWQPPVTDPWIVLGAIASHTERVKIGTMVAQLARRRPWKVAREVVTLDHLSGGRMILGVGLGFSGEAEFAQFGEAGDARARADRLDEALDIIDGLCTGEPFSYNGKYYTLKETTFTPRPVQERIPIWIAGYWPNKRPFRRAARWDGAAPAEMDIRPDGFSIMPTSPETAKTIGAYIDRHRNSGGPYDMIVSRELPDHPEEAEAMVRALEEGGVTWILRDMLPWEVPLDRAYEIVRTGPPNP
jgi:hypothetical protein